MPRPIDTRIYLLDERRLRARIGSKSLTPSSTCQFYDRLRTEFEGILMYEDERKFVQNDEAGDYRIDRRLFCSLGVAQCCSMCFSLDHR